MFAMKLKLKSCKNHHYLLLLRLFETNILFYCNFLKLLIFTNFVFLYKNELLVLYALLDKLYVIKVADQQPFFESMDKCGKTLNDIEVQNFIYIILKFYFLVYLQTHIQNHSWVENFVSQSKLKLNKRICFFLNFLLQFKLIVFLTENNEIIFLKVNINIFIYSYI